jgi:hypothetical protein
VAFLQLDQAGDLFMNISQPVGRGKPNGRNDVLVVQALLEIVYNNSPSHKKRRPGGRKVVVSNKLLQVTPTLIADFQRHDLKRPSPQGFCNPAPDTNSRELDFNTLFRLWNFASLVDAAINGARDKDLVARLQREHPSLRGLPQKVRETVITVPREREPLLIDSTR